MTCDAMPKVVLVGAGPGDPELLTLKAVKALRQATVALVDDLVHPDVLQHLTSGARIVHVGKRGGCASTPQAFIHRLMVAEARHGERVVRIKGGDPFVFGRGGEECDALRAAGIEVEVVNGLTAGIAGPAAIGVPVTDRRHTRGVALVTGHTGEDGGEPDWAALAKSGLTLVVYMGVTRVRAIAEALMAGGLKGDTPAAVIAGAHTPDQRQAVCELRSLAATLRCEGLVSPAILVIGDVVRAAPIWQFGDASTKPVPVAAASADRQWLPARTARPSTTLTGTPPWLVALRNAPLAQCRTAEADRS